MVLLFLIQFVERSMPPILPLYLGSISTPAGQLATIAGLVISAGAGATATSATIYGRLAQPGRTWALLALALSAGVVCVVPIGLADRWEAVLGLRLLLGLLTGGSLAMGYTVGSRLVPPERTGLALGVLNSSALVGSASAPFVAGLIGRFDLRAVFGVDALFYVAAIAVALLWLRRADRPAQL